MDGVNSAYQFGHFLLEPQEHRLSHQRNQIKLRPKTFDVLRYLVENHGHLATKEELNEALWPDTYVTETALRQCISEIREAISGFGNDSQFIKTIPKIGYQFIAEVKEIGKRKPSLHGSNLSIAVLPFRDMSPQKDQEYLCEGIAEEIINTLTNVTELRVVARSSAFSFKGKTEDIREIAEKLNARMILEGSVRTNVDCLRVSVQLIEASSGYHLWSEQYDNSREDIFILQREIANKILNKLSIQDSISKPVGGLQNQTDDLEAYHLCLKGRFYMSKESDQETQKAIEYYLKAIKEDPLYARAYGELSTCYLMRWTWDYLPSVQPLIKAKYFAQKAVDIDENLGIAHLAKGYACLYFDWDWREANAHFTRAVELSPGYHYSHTGYAWCQAIIGQTNEAIATCQRALEPDPLAPQVYTYLGMFYLRAGWPEKALQPFQESLELAPELPQAHWFRGQSLILLERFEEGLHDIKHALDLSGDNPMVLAGLGWAYGRAGQLNNAARIIQVLDQRSQTDHMSSYLYGKVYCGIGNVEQAFEHLWKAYKERDRKLIFVKTDETLADLRADNRFKTLLNSIGLPED